MGDAKQTWEQIVSQKRSARDKLLAPYLVDDVDNRLPQVHHVHDRTKLQQDPEGQSITDIDNISALQQAIQDGKYTAEKVIKSYIKRYVKASHHGTNVPYDADEVWQSRHCAPIGRCIILLGPSMCAKC